MQTQRAKPKQPVTMETVYSPDDGGWYSVMYERGTGRDVCEGEVKPSRQEAIDSCAAEYRRLYVVRK